MGQDINEMMQEAPVLTLDPFGETKEEVVEVKEEQVEELDVLTPEEKKMVADFAAKIDLRSSSMERGPKRRLLIFRKVRLRM